MKKAYRFARVLIAFVPASYFAGLFYRDLFILTEDNKLLFLVWAFPCLHLILVCMQLIIMLTGWQFSKHKNISVVKIYPIPICKFFPSHIRVKRFYFTIQVNNRERIVSGVFLHRPASILVYKDPFDKLKTFTPVSLLIKFISISANLTVLRLLINQIG
jgi:hypothetical protein